MDSGLIIDLETTGLDASKDQVIEVGILEFSVENQGTPVITEMYSALEDPGIAIVPEVERLTGINSSLVAGKKIDWEKVRTMLSRASIVIAHNASFDAAFLRRRPELADLSLHWGCSCTHIDWQAKGLRTRALNYLAADHGFVNPFAHRALFDCATTFRLISPYLSELIENSYEQSFYVFATGSAFETKDKLKARDYKWDMQKRCWYRQVYASQLAKEREFLSQEIYRGEPRHEEIEAQRL